MTGLRRSQHLPATSNSPRHQTRQLAPATTLRRVVLACLVSAGAYALPGATPSAWAVEASAARTYAIPAGPLADSLASFAARAGVSVLIDARLVEGRTAPALNGSFKVSDGFSQLLSGSGLEVVERSPSTWVLRPLAQPAGSAPAATVAAQAPVAESVLPLVRVNALAGRETALGPVSGYVARQSVTALKTDTPLLETPQSISVIGREEIEAKGMREVLDALQYTPGVFARTWGHDDRGYEYMALRGFQNTNDFSHNYLDGLSQWDFIDIGPITEMFGVERVEVLRGPSSATFGRGDVAGVVNRVSKRPSLTERIGEAQLQFGSFDHRQLAVDLGDRITDTLAVRIVGLTRSSDDQADYPDGTAVKTKRHFVAPSLLWKISPATSLTLLSSVVHHESGDDVGFLANAARQPTQVREGDPDFSRITQKAWTLGYELRHDLNDEWRLRQNFRHADREVDKRHIRPARLQADGRTVLRTAVRGVGEMTQTSLDSFVEGRVNAGAVQHQLVAGIDLTRMRGEEQEYIGAAPDLDLLQPVYRPVTVPTNPGNREGPYRLNAVGAYVQDQLRFDERWLLTLSARHDRTRVTAERSYAAVRHREDGVTTGRAGLTWLAGGGWAPYVSYGTSFHPAVGAFDGFSDEPTRGRQWEAGVKYQPAGRSLLFTAAVFDLQKRNMVVTNPSSGQREQVGSIGSRGVEFEFKGELQPGLTATAAYSYTDVSGRKGNTWYVLEGKVPVLTPEHLASAWLDYRLRGGALAGLTVGAGARYVGKRWDDAANTVAQGGYTLLDASVRHDFGPQWRLALNATNLAGKRYYSSNVFNNWLRGEERTVTITGTYRW